MQLTMWSNIFFILIKRLDLEDRLGAGDVGMPYGRGMFGVVRDLFVYVDTLEGAGREGGSEWQSVIFNTFGR